MNAIAVIPARYASTRFPGKALAILKGKPVIQHVFERVSDTSLFSQVIVATDDERIAAAVMNFGGLVRMTMESHASGSDRIAEVMEDIFCDIVVNVQGDEPLISGEPLQLLLSAFQDANVRVASLMTEIKDEVELTNPNVVKVVTDCFSNALYFSRSGIPYNRDNQSDVVYYRHIGVYAYRRKTLLEFVELPQTSLELTEKLEQLRLLENGIPIKMVRTDYQGIGIDTPQDLAQAEKLLTVTP